MIGHKNTTLVPGESFLIIYVVHSLSIHENFTSLYLYKSRTRFCKAHIVFQDAEGTQLNTQTIRSAALCYLGKCSIISAKCLCKVQEEGFENASNSVCRTRDACDRALQGLVCLNFFVLFWAEYIDVDALSFSHSFLRHEEYAISTQSLKKQKGKKKANGKDEESDDNEQFPDSSQVASSTMGYRKHGFRLNKDCIHRK